MFRRMIRRSFTVHRFIPIQPIIIQATCLGWGWHLAQDSYWEQRGQTIGAIAIGATATSPLTTKTISIETTSTISIVASKAENGSTTRSIAAALLTEIRTQLTSTAAALDNSRLAELTVPAVLEDAAVEAVGAAEEVGGNGLSREKIKSIPMRRGNRPTMTGPGPKSKDKCSLTIDF